MKWKKIEVTAAIGQAVSTSFTIEPWSIFYMALFPDMGAGNIGLELSIDGSNFYPVIDPADGSDAILVTSGADPGWVDFSDWIRGFGDNSLYKARFTFAVQDPAITIIVLMRG